MALDDHPLDPADVPFVATADAGAAEATVFTCGLCGLQFTHGGMACGECPLGRGCDTIGCPRCGHAFPRSSRLLDGLKYLKQDLKQEIKRLFRSRSKDGKS